MKLLFKLTFIFILGMTMMAKTTTISLKELSKQLPGEINGWKKSIKETFYNPGNLYEYINGGAELFISYNFQQMAAQKYIKEELPEITMDIFDMGNSFNAFGVFSHSRESLDNIIAPGVESEYASGLLTFWKGRYYVSIMAYPETEEKKKTVLSLGSHIAGLIQDSNEIPSVVSKLPEKNLVKESIRYFQHYIWLNSHYFISDHNILNIDKHTHAVLAKYKEEPGALSYFILLVDYPDPSKADAAYNNFMKNYLPDAQSGVKQLEDGKWTGCKHTGNIVMVILNAPDAKKIESLFEQITLKK
jgi:hypothetical protein